MNKIFLNFLFLLILFNQLPLAANQQSEEKPSLSLYIEKALTNNPRLEAMAQKVLAAEKAVPQAGALPDPKITLGLMNLPANSFAFDQEPMTGKQIGVSQMFPFPGKLSLKKDLSELEVKAVMFQQKELINQIIFMIKEVYYDIYTSDRAIETIEKNMELMKQIIQVVETKYATGTGLQQDLFRAQVELIKLEDDLLMWQQKRQVFTVRMNEILNQPENTPIGKIPELLEASGKEESFLVREQIENRRPLLLAWKEKVRMAEVETRLAQRDFWPDITVNAAYSQRDDLRGGTEMTDFLSVSLSLDIPLYFKNKQNQKIAAKQLEYKALKADYQSVLNSVLSEAESLKAELKRNRQRVDLYKEGIIPQAEKSLQSAQAGYQVGKVDFLNVVDNWMRLFNYELQYHSALADYLKTQAKYDLAVGKETFKRNRLQGQ
ncbi:MAG: TolC family protein [Acidobacteriota bacterium]